jgi:hypothetical protein
MPSKIFCKHSKISKILCEQGIYPGYKYFNKTVKPIGKAWQTNSATFTNFA